MRGRAARATVGGGVRQGRPRSFPTPLRSEWFMGIKDQFQQKADELKQKAKDMGDQASEKSKDSGNQARDKAQDAGQDAKDKLPGDH
ncbi:hypothetical protein SSBG_04457 [Streptomyces sp. SPB074]|nr:hypothetical protein SSBG_04457 [Streptomyces sp. SPB074]